jgi:hypothetical protein
MRRAARWAAVVSAATGLAVACGGSSNPSGFHGDDGGNDASGGGTDGQQGTDDSSGGDDGSMVFPDSGMPPPKDSGPPPQVAIVYAQSPDTLYKLDPTTNKITTVGLFTGGCLTVIDIAVDANSNGYVTTFTGFYKVDLKTAVCTHIADGSYPNSLSFVPKGTLDPNKEALVGYNGSQYIRIDTTTGAITNVGTGLSGGYASSGDIVSVINGGTFLTVTGPDCITGDCLLQVDPKTGSMVQNYGSTMHQAVYGLAFWAGTAYGFDDGGEVFSIGVVNKMIVTKNIPVMAGLQFYGAGSTTAAPPTSPDGGGIPIQ